MDTRHVLDRLKDSATGLHVTVDLSKSATYETCFGVSSLEELRKGMIRLSNRTAKIKDNSGD
jgi:hypothetical protein